MCKANDGPHKTYNTNNCQKYEKDGSHKKRLDKPSSLSKKATMLISIKKVAKQNKRKKKHHYYNNNSDSDS